jgi:hypothetical protein
MTVHHAPAEGPLLSSGADALAESSALRDFVGESNHGGQLWFVADGDELARRLA